MLSDLFAFADRRIVVLSDFVPLSMAARAMCEQNVGCVLVVDSSGRPSGILTDRDLAWEVASSADSLSSITISDAMTEDVVCVQESGDIEDVLQIMERYGIRRVPIVSEDENRSSRFIGIVTLDDLIAAKRVGPERLSQIVRQQVQQKTKSLISQTKRAIQSEEHKEHTLARFYKIVEQRCHLTRSGAEKISKFLLSCLVMRLTAHGAAQFIVQMPKLLQEDLFALPAGPDRSIDADSLLEGIRQMLQVTGTRAEAIINGFWDALLTFLNTDELDFVLKQLPEDLRILFSGSKEPIVISSEVRLTPTFDSKSDSNAFIP